VSAIVLRHLDAIGASMALLNAQFEALRHELVKPEPPPVAKEVMPERPERCAGIDECECALRNDEARAPRPTFTDRGAWVCVGCRFEGGKSTG
jgi:hypothetical protein